MEKKTKKLRDLKNELKRHADADQAKQMQRYFKTDKGEYGEGDIFLGLKAPVVRALMRDYVALDLDDLEKLLKSGIHEERSVALAILRRKFERAAEEERKSIFDFYIDHTENINNWDLVDLSAPTIVGGYLLDKDRKILYEMARSENLWRRRISIISTFAFIKEGDCSDSLRIAEMLLDDKHDLIHKAVGWTLREVGKKDIAAEEKFLKKHGGNMPRTALRYAIEKFDAAKRRQYMSGGRG